MELRLRASINRREKIQDWTLISLLVSLGSSGITLVNHPLLWNAVFSDESSGVPVGEVLQEQGGVRFRPRKSLFWRDVPSGKRSVGNEDAVFTNHVGMAKLNLDGSGEAKVMPDSLVIVSQGVKPAVEKRSVLGFPFSLFRKAAPKVLEVKKGSITMSLAAGQKVVLRSNDKLYRLDGDTQDSQVVVTRSDQGVSFATIQGHANLQEVSEVAEPVSEARSLERGMETKIANNKVEQSVLSPADFMAKADFTPDGKKEELTEKGSDLADKGDPSMALTDTVSPQGTSIPTVSAQAVTPELPPVMTASPEKLQEPSVETGKKIAVENAAPIVANRIESISADGSTKYHSDLDSVMVNLAWKAVPSVSEYHVSIYNSDGSELSRESVRESKVSMQLRFLPQNQYTYQITATTDSGQFITSGQLPIHIQLVPPRLKEPMNGSKQLLEHDIFITWEKTALTQYYEFQISSDSDFRRVVLSQKTKPNLYVLKNCESGNFYWRVRALAGSVASSWSEPFSFIVKN